MDWILDNLQNVVVPIIILILYGLGSAAQKKEKQSKQGKGKTIQEVDPDETRRVREIQEEIRRKIAERTGRTPPPLRPSSQASREARGEKPTYQEGHKLDPRPSQKFPGPARRQPQPADRHFERPATPPAFPQDMYQREIKAKLRKARELEEKAKARTQQIKVLDQSWDAPSRKTIAGSELRKQLFKDLAHPLGQKKAILVSEILGKPVGLKGPSGWKSNV
ncbi:MAG: hypothetical protein KJT03_07950 [Verrucomicrobiae bacterium]|nr:hypothetical protein [Verrucomicrobiae bacterium]